MSLLTVGTVAFDNIETPWGKKERVVGGAATYISLAASYFTEDIRLVSIIGDDFPDDFLEGMRKRGIDMAGLQIKQGEKSFFLGRALSQRPEYPGHPGYSTQRTGQFQPYPSG